MKRYRVAFICVENAFRSQIAQAFAELRSADVIEAFSGGSAPASTVDPAAVAVMREVGIDISGRRPKSLPDEVLRTLDLIVHMGCGDGVSCLAVLGVPSEDWNIDDPGSDIDKARETRETIRAEVDQLAERLRQGKVQPEVEFKLNPRIEPLR